MINYFNYFTETEEHFQRARGTSLFLLSPLDWALVESWKNTGIPLEAVLRGIDIAFEKWRSRRHRVQQVNSLAFCSQAVLTEAQRMPESASEKPSSASPFPENSVSIYLRENSRMLRCHPSGEYTFIADSLDTLAAEDHSNLEALEQSLSVLEAKMVATARLKQTDEDAVAIKRDLDAQLRPYRGKMSAPQLDMLERQYMERQILDRSGLPRLSLFYLH